MYKLSPFISFILPCLPKTLFLLLPQSIYRRRSYLQHCTGKKTDPCVLSPREGGGEDQGDLSNMRQRKNTNNCSLHEGEKVKETEEKKEYTWNFLLHSCLGYLNSVLILVFSFLSSLCVKSCLHFHNKMAPKLRSERGYSFVGTRLTFFPCSHQIFFPSFSCQ